MTIDRNLTVAVLKIVAGSRFDAGPVATRFMNRAFPDRDLRHGSRTVRNPTARTNRFMHKLREAGLAEGVDGRHGGIRWWRITDAGRTFLRDHAS